MSEALQAKLLKMQEGGPLDSNSYHLQPKNLLVARSVLGASLRFAPAVESEVPYTANLVRVLLPNLDDQTRAFVDEWELEEKMHGVILRRLAGEIGVIVAQEVIKATTRMKAIGELSKRSQQLHGLLKFVYLVEGALSERETLGFYKIMGEDLEAEGEDDLAQLMADIEHQEARHLGYYRQAAKEMDPPKSALFAARKIIEQTYTPVGVQLGNQQRTRLFGDVIRDLSRTREVSSLYEPAQEMAFDLLGQKTSPNFLERRYDQCLAA